MTRKPVFWIVFSVLGAAGCVVALRLFAVAFPIISLDIEMDRQAAISQAEALSEQYGWAPPDARSAASFGQFDSEVQTYVELEGGGRGAFVELADRGVYQPYGWTVRRFSEGSVEESRVRFTPSGEAYGFRLRLAEDDPGGGNVSDEAARGIAEEVAAEWGVNLAPFELLEASEETQPGGRVDHTLVFERADEAVGEAKFRLRVRVAGDQASELTHFVQVPEAFSQRYLDMRSDNDAIALVSQSVFILVFVLLGAGVGTALLLRQRWVVWRTPLAWGAVTAVLFGLNSVNELPLSWMGYDTAVSARLFFLEQVAAAGLIALVGTPLLAFFFLAGESLGRRAFPDHLQQWRFWSPEVASSNAALGRTVAAYLLLGMHLGYVVLFYLGTSRLEGWWSPADALVNPDLLATLQPWLQAVSLSLFAAFSEESVFRAVPIACAALIGARYGRKGLWVWGAVAIQAVIFAAAHANYPQQPAYARVIELSFPAFVWGVVYLYYGLVPTILTHFVYNLSLISIPLFAADAPGLLFDRAVVIAVGLVPLWAVTKARFGGRARAEAPDWAFNRAWTPPAAEEPAAEEVGGVPEAPRPAVPTPGRLPVPRGLAYAAGAVGAVIWAATLLTPGEDPPRLTESRGAAVAAARTELESRGHDVDVWTALASIPSGRGNDHRYVFEEAGVDVYERLLGGYLGEPRWIVRFVDFGAEAEERIEEFRVHVGSDAEVLRVDHVLPEARAGESLEEDVARAAALDVLSARFGLGAANTTEVGAEQTARPERTDWEFTFADPSALADVEGEARVTVELSGDEVADVRRFVHVPEEWERARRDADRRRTFVIAGVVLILLLGFGAADVLAIIAWAKRSLANRTLLKVSGLAVVAMALAQANAWPGTTSVFSSAQPWGLQVGLALFGLVLVVVVGSAAIGLAAALAHSWLGDDVRQPAAPALAVAVGFTVVGLGAAGELAPGGLPSWPDFSSATSFVPALGGALAPILPYLFTTSALLLLCALAVRSKGRPVLTAVVYLAVVCLGLTVVPASLQEAVATWIPAGLVGAAVVLFLTRVGAAIPALVPGILATMMVAELVEDAIVGAHGGATVGAVLGVIVVVLLAREWTRVLAKPESRAAEAA